MSDIPSTSPPDGLQLAREWPTVMLLGVVTLVLGVVVLAWPQETLTVLSVILGIQLLLFGVYRFVAAFASETLSPGFSGFVGILAIVSGVIVLRNPFESAAALAVILGVLWIIAGLIDLMAAIADSTLDHRWLTAFGGLLSLAAGVIVVSWPAPTITVIAWVAGLYLVIYGLFIAFSALQLRSLTRR